MNTKFSGKTGQTLEISLDSRIASVFWDSALAHPGKPVTFTVQTQFVRDQSDIRFTFRDGGGSTVGKSQGRIVQGMHRQTFLVPADIEGPLSFEVELPDHGLSARSAVLRVETPPRITEAKILSATEDTVPELLDDGMEYRIQAKVANIPPRRHVVWTLCEQDEKGRVHRVQKGRCTVQNGVAEAKFRLDFGPRSAGIPSAEEAQRLQMTYRNPMVYATVGCLGVEADAPSIAIRQKMVLRFWSRENFAGPFEGKSIPITAPDGAAATETIPQDGVVVVEVSIPGIYTVDLTDVAELI
ncbi:MAG: hypothetical protein H6686_08505 [Fibrobacteria bacterium]|nr:hypothetical protein [Fibrobacteria bacterium]